MLTKYSKANKQEFQILDSKFKDLDVSVEQLRDYINNLKIPKSVDNTGDEAKYKELERMLVGLEGKLDRTQEALNDRMNDINKFMDLIKEDVDKTLEENEKQVLKTMSRCGICEVRIDALEKQFKDYTPRLSTTMPDFEGKEALRAVRDLELKLKTLKEDLNKRLLIIETNELPMKASKKEVDDAEERLLKIIRSLEKDISKLKLEIQSIGKAQDGYVKEIRVQKQLERDNARDEAVLMKRPLMGWKCVNCERDLNNLEGSKAEFYNWRKLPKSISTKKQGKVNMNMHNIGQGFSKMLQTLSTDNIYNKDLFKTNEEHSNTMIEDEEDEEVEVMKSTRREIFSDNEADSPRRRKLPIINRK